MADAGGRSSAANVKLPIYLDYQATTPADPRVVEAMLPYFTEKFGNPHSREHAFGLESEHAVDGARDRIAALIGADPKEIVFTSGATESNNLALKGVARFWQQRRPGKRDHLITLATEHKCVLETCRQLEHDGFAVTYLPVPRNGLIDLDGLREAVGERTLLVSVMGANNEIGVIQPLAEIGAICRERGAFFHSDCAQAVGKIPLDVDEMNIDLMSLSGHKIYGPKGIGVLYVRRRPRVRLTPLIDGGGQERGMRSGTLPTPLCVGLGEACAIAEREMAAEDARIRGLRDRLYNGITGRISGVSLNGDLDHRLAGNLNLGFAGVGGESLLAALEDLAVSSGSACTSASIEPSYVLRALGVDDSLIDGSIRFGVGRFTTEAEIDYAVGAVVEHVGALRAAPVRETA
ncbi:MAG: IscS subfamily cysteine desulfurase [Proteobacteria bacterium]|nr:IscS subfamily cysteine desulfurase [Pseudomonadota bacterium]